MRLKSVKIYGFKSFADRTDIDVDGNLVAVVGPNGCGKSNLVDAILWALGELSPKHLRAQVSTDVIFGGSAKRKQLGYAEVILTFDNEEGLLPVMTTEVTVGRKVTRSGESDYSINGRACRLKDIYELFADSGLGRTGYAIVTQSDIDQALSAAPEMRRVWLDEAAGVQKYRTRKKEALSRLESALQHLTRVEDVIAEIDRQREPLREEAEAARTYKQKLGSLREIESGLLIVEVSKLKEQIDSLEVTIRERRSQSEQLRAEAEADDAESERLLEQVRVAEAEVEQLVEQLNLAVAAVERASSKRALAQQRLRNLEELDENREREEGAAKARLERAERLVKAYETELQEAEQSLAVLLQVISGSEQDAKAFAAKLEDAEKRLSAARLEEVEKIQSAARLAHAKERLKQLERELEGAKEAIPELESGLKEAELRHAEAKSGVESIRGRTASIASERTSNLEALHQIEESRRKVLAESASLEGKVQGLRATLESGEGLIAGARAVLEAAKARVLKGDYRPLASAIHVPSEFATAIEAALGAAAGDLITSKADYAKVAIEYLKKEGLGRATFLAADLVNPRPRPQGISALAKEDGILGVAADLVSCDPADTNAIELHLGGVLVAEGIDNAVKLARREGFRKIVTLDGEVLYAGGAVTGGRSAKQSSGPLKRQAELEEAEKRLKICAEEAERLSLEASDLESTGSKLMQEERLLLAQLDSANIELSESVQWVAALREEKTATERAMSKLTSEILELEAEVNSNPSTYASETDAEKLEAERNELLSLAAGKAADADQAKRALEEIEERVRVSKERLQQAELELADAQNALEHRVERLSNFEGEREAQIAQLLESENELERAVAQKAEAEANLARARDARRNLQEESRSRSEHAKTKRELARNLEDAAYRDDINRARLETKRAGTLARLIEEYNTDEDEAMKQAPLVEIPADAAKIANELRRELKALGDVNLGAIEAYERLTERYDVLARERDDVLSSKAELDKSVAELDRLTRGAFTETFEKVNQAFGEMFAKLFGGGEARLILTNAEKILETGVDIEVQVPGKKTQRLELLSGGERALSACAFLFALFKVKPSPLVVLDELDAPLDGRNVERYVDLLKTFAERMQFIVITHNPTTIEAAPVWFGVTMQEPGVSTVVPYRSRRPELEAAGEVAEEPLTLVPQSS
ncbi:MAG: chromosome segregation protein SMC [Fimbriimonadales bacterium]|nr:chromosome segregation protein SMC [Fimbriimonadales bacterium]